ncbi:laccase, multicopper oxidase, benzenediol:oxygen oxidorectuctase [Cerrena zonata]|uniref:laccase n=1 Tax=Cerrena zonata TaxID=2478898 RepID=A0AAW0FUV8_9APHY
MSSKLLTLAFIALALSLGTYAGTGPVTDLRIVNKDIAPDGFMRPTVLAGGTFPGALITGQKGDNFQINVIDELTDDRMLTQTSIHWHGFFQKGTSWADGPAFVTQCPIVTGNSFLYEFDVPDQPGTFWYHSHLSTQYCDGLRGPFVVYDPNDPNKQLYDIDNDDTVITLADWYHVLARTVVGVATPDATLINGLGRSPSGPADAELAVITVERGKRYRFRLVSISCDPNYIFSIDDHSMTVIEVDGVNTQSLTVDSIQIFAGQRYSFVLHANRPENNYWIRARPNVGADTTTVNGMNSAILRYVGAPVAEPQTPETPSLTPLLETSLRPLVYTPVPGNPTPGGADIVHTLDLSFDAGRFSVNGASFHDPTVPVLLQILSGTHNAQDLLPPGSVIGLELGKVVELVIPAGVVGGPHPFHLHGHNFWVVRSAGSSQYNFNDAILRDVVSIGGAGDQVTIRFVTDNPGPWFLHCHIDWHLEAGLAVVFAEGAESTAAANPTPPAWDELCPKYNALSAQRKVAPKKGTAI